MLPAQCCARRGAWHPGDREGDTDLSSLLVPGGFLLLTPMLGVSEVCQVSA